MSGSGRAGNGRGSSRRRPFKRRENNTWHGNNAAELQSAELRSADNKSMDGRPGDRKSAGAAEKRGRENDSPSQGRQNRGSLSKKNADNAKGEQKRSSFFDRPKWIPPRMNTDPLPVPDCPWCGKPIRDLSQAISDRETGVPVHFDCVASRIAGRENLDKGEAITYIGGGRFGIVNFGSAAHYQKDSRDKSQGSEFRIKKVIEWEKKDQRAEWRSAISDHYSVT